MKAPFVWFGGKRKVAPQVWAALGDVDNYVEPFAGSLAVLLARPHDMGDGSRRAETVNDADGFLANFWRAVALNPEAVAAHADYPVNEVDLFARHLWLVNDGRSRLLHGMESDPDWYDAKIAGWWVWGVNAWIGSGWCSGTGPWIHDGEKIVDSRQLPHLGNAGQGINRKLPHLGDAGQGINRQLPHLSAGQGHPRRAYIMEWFGKLHDRLRDVRVTCGDWSRVVKDSVTTRHGLTGLFLDPPYTLGAMDYAAGGVGGDLATEVRAWCAANGQNQMLRIVLCGHKGEHDALLANGWHARAWTARKGYAMTDEAVANSAGETIWCSPHCMPERGVVRDLFAEAA